MTSPWARLGRGLGLLALVCFAGAALESRALGRIAIQAGIAEMGRGWLGLAWVAPALLEEPRARLTRETLRGAAFGAVAVVLAVVAATLAGARFVGSTASTGVGAVVLAALTVALGTARDELLVRGLPFAILPSRGRGVPFVVTAAVAAAAWASAESAPPLGGFGLASFALGSAQLGTVMTEAAASALAASMWLRGHGALPAAALTFTFRFARTLLAGGVGLTLAAAPPPWGGGASDPLGGGAVALVLAGAAAVRVSMGNRPPRGDTGAARSML